MSTAPRPRADVGGGRGATQAFNGRIRAQVLRMGDVLKRTVAAAKELHVVVVWTGLVFTAGGAAAMALMNIRGLPARLAAVEVAVAATADSLAEHKRTQARMDSMQDIRTAVLVARVICAVRKWDRNPNINIDDAVLECQADEEKRRQGLRVNGGPP